MDRLPQHNLINSKSVACDPMRPVRRSSHVFPDSLPDCRCRDRGGSWRLRSCGQQLGHSRRAWRRRCQLRWLRSSVRQRQRRTDRDHYHRHRDRRRPCLRCWPEPLRGGHHWESAGEDRRRRHAHDQHCRYATIACSARLRGRRKRLCRQSGRHYSSLRQERKSSSYVYGLDRLDHLHWHRSESGPKNAVHGVWRQDHQDYRGRQSHRRPSGSASAGA